MHFKVKTFFTDFTPCCCVFLAFSVFIASFCLSFHISASENSAYFHCLFSEHSWPHHERWEECGLSHNIKGSSTTLRLVGVILYAISISMHIDNTEHDGLRASIDGLVSYYHVALSISRKHKVVTGYKIQDYPNPFSMVI